MLGQLQIRIQVADRRAQAGHLRYHNGGPFVYCSQMAPQRVDALLEPD
jgi:hypothetical protein